MGIREDALALADELEAFEGYTCERCAAYEQPECGVYLPCTEIVAKYCARRIREAVERDGEGATTVSAYDLLSEDEREAIAWVREHGGLAAVEKRLMPEGMEWPRYIDGSAVEIGDEVVGPDYGERIHVDAVKFHANGFTFYDKNGFDKWYEDDDRIERSEPKVLDADGVEIRVGDTVYVLGFGEPLTVKGFADDGRVLMSFHGENSLGYKPSKLTHEQPDTWERLEEDCAKFCIEYCDEHGLLDSGCNATEGDASTRHCTDCGYSCEERMARDLVRRCKELARKENKNE